MGQKCHIVFVSSQLHHQFHPKPTNMHQAKLATLVPGTTRMAVIRVTDIKSAFELVMGSSMFRR